MKQINHTIFAFYFCSVILTINSCKNGSSVKAAPTKPQTELDLDSEISYYNINIQTIDTAYYHSTEEGIFQEVYIMQKAATVIEKAKQSGNFSNLGQLENLLRNFQVQEFPILRKLYILKCVITIDDKQLKPDYYNNPYLYDYKWTSLSITCRYLANPVTRQTLKEKLEPDILKFRFQELNLCFGSTYKVYYEDCSKDNEITSIPFSSASQISSQYYNNEVKADELYKGKTLRLKGIVKSVNKDLADNIYLIIQPINSYLTIHCSMINNNGVSNLNRNSSIKIQGDCVGLLLGDICLSNCEVLN